MAFLEVHFSSGVLNLASTAYVLMPQAKIAARERKIPTLYLLHGYSDDHSIWMRRTSIERHIETYAPDFAVVMPAIDHSWYTDMKHGNHYWTYLSEELPEIMSSLFPLSGAREDTFVAGLSMGGYGALKLALSHPERFLACASFSGACDMGSQMNSLNLNDSFSREMADIFGTSDDFKGSANDLFHQAGQIANSKIIPNIYMACGTKDFLYQSNLNMLEHLKELQIPVKWEATPGKEHTWDYWDDQIQIALRWFAELRAKAKK